MRVFLAVLVYGSLAPRAQAQTCQEEGVCVDNRPLCGLPPSFCQWSAKQQRTMMYRYGGVAQAYSPGAPVSDSVCDPSRYRNSRHLVAGWPFSRSSRRSAPTVSLQINVWSCHEKDAEAAPMTNQHKASAKKTADESSKCCCDPLGAAGQPRGDNLSVPAATIEIWQARPDGTYSPLRSVGNFNTNATSDRDDSGQGGDCRARIRLDPGSSAASVTTVAPGSTGALQGLGPNRWDFPPFGPPVVHVLATAPGHAPTLFDLPLLFHRRTLEAKRSMLGGDWRGSAWMREDPQHKPYEVRRWVGLPEQNKIEVDLNVYLTRLPPRASTTEEAQRDGSSVSTSLWCPSLLYGLPSSFFLEPIAVCARPLLDFFEV